MKSQGKREGKDPEVRETLVDFPHPFGSRPQPLLGARFEDQVRQAQKMEAVGCLAAGIAHDFNNLLTIILGYSEVLLDRFSADDPAARMIQDIKVAGERAASLTRQLLAFSRQQVLAPQVLDLATVVREMEPLLRRLIGEDIELIIRADPHLGPVMADRCQMEQVLLNLAVNARDAMPRGGRLTIETRNTEPGANSLPPHLAIQPGRYVMLGVTDTGCGMDLATQAHLFEPFFTTKVPGRGTGLGLATIDGIVKQSQGTISVDSKPGRGTTFTVFLPCTECLASSSQTLVSSAQDSGGQETILVAEDDDGLRSLIGHILTRKGYQVLEARNGMEALRIGGRHPGPIHLLVSDVVMPQLNGGELASRLAPFRPGMRILFLSGYAEDAAVRHGALEGEIAFLQKPFLPHALCRMVREVLDREGSGS